PALSEVEGAPAPLSHSLSAQQVPRFLIPRMLGRLQVRRQDDTTRALACHFDWNDVPDIFRDDVGGYEINFVLCIRLLPACAEMAIVRFIHLRSSRFHLHPQEASAGLLTRKFPISGFAPSKLKLWQSAAPSASRRQI